MPETCAARTETSGSAMVTNAPSKKQTNSKSHMLRDLERPEPTCSPIGVIAMSAPKLKSAIPKIKTAAAMRNAKLSCKEKETSGVKPSKMTIKVTGRMDIADSLILSHKARNTLLAPFLFLWILDQEPMRRTCLPNGTPFL